MFLDCTALQRDKLSSNKRTVNWCDMLYMPIYLHSISSTNDKFSTMDTVTSDVFSIDRGIQDVFASIATMHVTSK